MKVGDLAHLNVDAKGKPTAPASPLSNPTVGTYEVRVLANHGQWVWIRPLRYRPFGAVISDWRDATKNNPITVLHNQLLPNGR